MAGDKSISENYAFAGMHHIFDQHKSAGTWQIWAITGLQTYSLLLNKLN